MKYAILRTLDDPYIYDNEVEFMEKTFETECEAIAYVQDKLIPHTEKEYSKDFSSGYHTDVKVAENGREYAVTLYPDDGGEYAHEIRFEIIEFFDIIEEKNPLRYVLRIGKNKKALKSIDTFASTQFADAKIVASHYARLGKYAEVVADYANYKENKHASAIVFIAEPHVE